MDLGGDGVSVYAEAKSEYTKQLCQYLVPPIQQFFLDLLEEAKEKEADSKRVLLMFQTLLEDISDWNADKVQRETAAISQKSQCDYLEELMTAVFIAHTKVLSAIRLTTKQKKLQITIPKIDHFIHRTLRECSRLLWSNTYLFSTNAASIERQKNQRQIESFLNEGVLQGIRSMLPVKNILREYLKDDGDEEAEAGEEAAGAAEAAEAKEATEAAKATEATEATEAEESKVVVAKVPIGEPKAAAAAPVTIDIEETAEVNTMGATTPISFSGEDTLEQKIEVQGEASEAEAIEEVRILEGPPEDMDAFEDLEQAVDILPMDFETLN
jgi:hypothetical protein